MWPALLLLRINRFWLPLPLFLLWPLLLVVAAVAISLTLIRPSEYSRFVCHTLWGLGTVRGLQVAVEDKNQRFALKFI